MKGKWEKGKKERRKERETERKRETDHGEIMEYLESLCSFGRLFGKNFEVNHACKCMHTHTHTHTHSHF